MRVSKTTVAGIVAASALTATMCPGLPHWLDVGLTITAAGGLACLGKFSVDCPANCPGTDDDGKPIRKQRTLPFFGVVAACIVFISVVFAFAGCVSRNPAAGPGNPTAPAYVVSPALTSSSNIVAGLAPAVGTATGTGNLVPIAVNGIFGLIGALSIAWARHKNEVAAQMATGVVSAGPAATQAVMDSASNGTKYAAIAELLNNNTPPGVAPGTQTK